MTNPLGNVHRRPPRGPRPLDIDILHADDAVIVVNKPAERWGEDGDSEPLDIVQRLSRRAVVSADDFLEPAYACDPHVSGALLLARSQPSLDALRSQIAEGALELTCLALIRGPLIERSGTCGAGSHMMDSANPAPQSPRTEWRLRDSFIGFSLLECRPIPADADRVRAQLRGAGMPLAVDPLYGGGQTLMLSSFKAGYHRSNRHEERPLLQRVSLHIETISFTHPTTGGPLRLEAPLPKDFSAALHQLDRFGRLPR